MVSTARKGLSEEQLADKPLGGGLFELDPGTRGVARARVRWLSGPVRAAVLPQSLRLLLRWRRVSCKF